MEYGVKTLLLENQLFDYFAEVPDELRDPNPSPLYAFEKVIRNLRPNTDRMRIEVY
ncbi:MAG: hypothetical protein MAGBODY4_00146 [Candidatus Marinimicrobia bacterium]|nr:hypothetical protein [Candidatus Neomarinimicrobiota bacterium]